MVTAVSKSQKTRKVVNQDMEQMVEVPSEAPEEVSDPLAALMNQAQAAYTSYLQAQRKVAEAYQERQHQSETSYKEIEENAAKICTAALGKAERALEKAEQEADEACLKVRMEAKRVYQDSVNEALRLRDETIQQAWEETKRNSERIWKVFQGKIEK